MFWWRRKKTEIADVSPVHTLASRLGIERRKNPRVLFPDTAAFATLPMVFFQGQLIRMKDLSVGGCCLWDPQEVLGSQIGQDIDLTLRWNLGEETIKAKLISRVDHRRHIQFVDVKTEIEQELKKLIAPGVYAHDLKLVELKHEHQQQLLAKEIWTSIKGDSAIIDHDIQLLASLHIMGKGYRLLREAWPQRGDGSAVSPREFETIVLFLANIPNPSQDLKKILERLVRLTSVRSVA